MSRPVRYLIPATLLSVCFAFTGCTSIYSDMYSPRRNHFVPVKPKPKPEVSPLVTDGPVPTLGNDLLPSGLPPAAPPSAPVPATDTPPMPADGAPPADPAAPMVPGL